jgi:hypothetical protein
MLVAMRLKDMHKVHPDQDNSHICLKCGETVGLYPSGQMALKANPGTGIMCVACAALQIDDEDEMRPAGTWADVAREIDESRDA